MSSKTEHCYTSLFQYINNNIFDMDCQAVLTDYENAMRNAVKSVCTSAQKDQCWFHYCQALKRAAARMRNFFNFIKSNSSANKIYHKFMALPLLPRDKIEEGVITIDAEISGLDMNDQFKEFRQYYRRQWLNRVSSLILLYTQINYRLSM